MTDGEVPGWYDPRSWWERWSWVVRDWQIETFGLDGFSVITNFRKLAKEATEAANGLTLDEVADCRICLMAAEAASGYTELQIRYAVARKMAINRARKWARQPDGTWQHVKENEDE